MWCVVLLGLATGCFGGGSSGTPHAAQPLALSGLTSKATAILSHRLETVVVTGHPYDVTSAAGAFWASTTFGVSKLPVTGRRASELRLPGQGEWSAAANSGRTVWILSSDGTLSTVDSRSLARRMIKLPSPGPYDTVGASQAGFCATRYVVHTVGSTVCRVGVAGPSTYGIGPGEVVGFGKHEFLVGGKTLDAVDPTRHSVTRVATPDGQEVSAMTPLGTNALLATTRRTQTSTQTDLLEVAPDGRRAAVKLGAASILALAVSDRIWVLAGLKKKEVLGYVGPHGVVPVARVPKGCLGLAAIGSTIATTDYPTSTVYILTIRS